MSVSKRVLFVSTLEAAPWGGSEELWYHMASVLLDRGHEVGVNRIEWSPVPKKLQLLIEKGAQVFYRPNIHIPRPRTDLLFKVRVYRHRLVHHRFIQSFAPDSIVVSQGGNIDSYLQDLAPYLIASGIPYYIMCHYSPEHNVISKPARQTFRTVFASAAMTTFVSRRNMEVTQRMIASEAAPGQVMYHPPITIQLSEIPAWLDDNVIRMACVARLDTSFKGQDVLLEVLSDARWRTRNWQLSFYGDGPDKDYLKELVAVYELNEKIIFQGHVSGVREIWANNHLLVLPSLSEGTPLSLFEASYYGRPAVVTDVGGCGEIVTEGKTGFVVPATTSSALSAGLERAWERQCEWQQMGARAREDVMRLLDNNDLEMMLARLVKA